MTVETLPAETIPEEAIETAIAGSESFLPSVNIEESFAAYKELQMKLDRAMPDQILEFKVQNKKTKQWVTTRHRRKKWWYAVGTFYGIQIEPVKDDFIETKDRYAWIVTYKATADNGRIVHGDGACCSKEKSKGFMDETMHNVRAHAHSRAICRAVSLMMGFGEVSAEEMLPPDMAAPGAAGPITEPQKAEIQKLRKELSIAYEDFEASVKQMFGRNSHQLTDIEAENVLTGLRRSATEAKAKGGGEKAEVDQFFDLANDLPIEKVQEILAANFLDADGGRVYDPSMIEMKDVPKALKLLQEAAKK